MSFTVTMPIPPSTNRLFGRSKTGRVYRNPSYEAWRKAAGWQVMLTNPKPLKGRYRLTITAPKNRKDLGNLEKAISDLLVWLRLVEDDRLCDEITLKIDQNAKDVTVSGFSSL